MPFYKSGDQQQTEEFVATLDAIQEVIDKYAPMGPLQLCGDLNVQLPRGYKLSKSWHTLKGYSAHSLIMYDFISANDLICADFRYPQTVNYTYFQHETKAYTWIDHVLVSASMSYNQIVNCFIHEYNEHNMSDPYLLSLSIRWPVWDPMLWIKRMFSGLLIGKIMILGRNIVNELPAKLMNCQPWTCPQYIQILLMQLIW